MGMGADVIDSAADGKPFSADQSVRQFVSGRFINGLYCGTGNLHLLGALRLGKSKVVNKADGFVFIYGHVDLTSAGLKRHKFHHFGELADLPALDGTGHRKTSFCM